MWRSGKAYYILGGGLTARAHHTALRFKSKGMERMAVNGFGERIERIRRAAYPEICTIYPSQTNDSDFRI